MTSDPSRIDEVLRPWELAATFLLALGIAAVASAVDDSRAAFTMQVWALPLILLSVGALAPYFGSALGLTLGTWRRVIGVRTARAGAAGLLAAIAIAVVLWSPPGLVLGAIALVTGAGLVVIERLRLIHSRDLRQR